MTTTRPTAPRVVELRDSPARGTLRRAVALLEVDRRRFAFAVLLGTLALGCAVALAAVSAWLIARASQMPPVLTLSVATVGVRAFGVGRGVLRYVERLVSHDLALSGMSRLRTSLYERLASGQPGAVLAVRRGDLLARVGADVDDVGDLVVRGLLPAAVAATLGVATTAAMTMIWPPAGLALGACLVLAGVVAPWLADRGARTSERLGTRARADVTAEALALLDDAGPLTVAGRVPQRLAALREADARARAAVDAGAGPSALAAGLGQLATGLAVLAALVTGIPAVGDGRLAPVLLAVVVLTPLAAFEATSVLPQAAVQVHRSRAAAARILALLDAAGTAPDGTAPDGTASAETAPADTAQAAGTRATRLAARDLVVGWPGGPDLLSLDLDLRVGRLVAVVGPSGTGKTTLLLTLAGLLAPHAGDVDVDGSTSGGGTAPVPGRSTSLTAEDAHVFGTTLLENLRVARGDVTPDEASAALAAVGLGTWLADLPDGLATPLGPDGRTLSGGERRRLLLARALLTSTPFLLLDEPTEHLDGAGADDVLHVLRAQHDRGVLVVTHRLTGLEVADEVIRIADGRVAARGTHAHLLAHDDGYREAVQHELQDQR
ncbi:thiol reductant ABC exporter subunit CydC [Cellulomonas uda]|uniref:Thiol reductant ABC exporter subunit CydC n=1 Tax=Cellulomonas uda TaxID=1714 RepID=A0A4Y3KC45_CELUD|nr:thiol reductant ABC exporter subunit CydC [Cellulomonas uda]NII65393.1 ATP-binding cassette subfamily C protein CydC [Cellulomonas uda]GEA80568.1 thiol reductant ABC exporter subunit CydC [Cellulomonas uda]